MQIINGCLTLYPEQAPNLNTVQLAAMIRGSGSLVIAMPRKYDGIGNPVASLADFNGAALSISYDPYGLPTIASTSTQVAIDQNPYLFKGGIQDHGTGWVKFGQRWYNLTTGSWTQQDTLDAPLDPANANRYAYAGDDPINGIDPTGKLSSGCALAILGVIFSTIGLASSIATIVVSLAVEIPSLGLSTFVGALGAAGFIASSTGEVLSIAGIATAC